MTFVPLHQFLNLHYQGNLFSASQLDAFKGWVEEETTVLCQQRRPWQIKSVAWHHWTFWTTCLEHQPLWHESLLLTWICADTCSKTRSTWPLSTAKFLLLAAPTFVANEHLFSSAAEIYKSRCNWLLPKHADMLLFLKYNLSLGIHVDQQVSSHMTPLTLALSAPVTHTGMSPVLVGY